MIILSLLILFIVYHIYVVLHKNRQIKHLQDGNRTTPSAVGFYSHMIRYRPPYSTAYRDGEVFTDGYVLDKETHEHVGFWNFKLNKFTRL